MGGVYYKGDRVMFGSGQGVKTLGEVIKAGPKNLVVKQLQDRVGRGKIHAEGSTWTVPIEMCKIATQKDINKALGPTKEELALMGTTTELLAPRPSPYNKQLFQKAFEACEAITQASIFWDEDDEKKNPYLEQAQEAAGAFLAEARSRGLRNK